MSLITYILAAIDELTEVWYNNNRDESIFFCSPCHAILQMQIESQMVLTNFIPSVFCYGARKFGDEVAAMMEEDEECVSEEEETEEDLAVTMTYQDMANCGLKSNIRYIVLRYDINHW